jgi:hypothetical protein
MHDVCKDSNVCLTTYSLGLSTGFPDNGYTNIVRQETNLTASRQALVLVAYQHWVSYSKLNYCYVHW